MFFAESIEISILRLPARAVNQRRNGCRLRSERSGTMANQEELDPARALEEHLRANDLASPSHNKSSVARFVDSFRKLGGTKRPYQLRRYFIIVLGFSVPLLVTGGLDSLKGAFIVEPVNVGKEFVGDFPLRAQISSEFNPLPGGAPRLRVSSQPKGGEEWTTVFEVTALEPEKLDEVYAEFVTEQVAFALYDTLFAVTTNGGYSWETTVVHDTLSARALVIDGVILDERGSGFLFPPGVKSFDSCWTTEDFGLSWVGP